MSHRILTTAFGNLVHHHHHATDLSAATKASLQASYLADPAYPGIEAIYYTHLNATEEELLPTNRYNCWGFTFNPRQCAIDTGTDVQTILNDNGTQVVPPNLRLGDVICYRKNGMITHTGRIVALNAIGEPALVQSKWGDLGEYFHAPLVVPSSYGAEITYWRVVPLSGKGEAWVADNSADDRLPCPPGTLCQSPDLWLNNHGGAYHEDAVGGSPNNIYVRVHNRDTLPIVGGTVHVYWSDPTTGMPYSQWHPIGTAPIDVAPGADKTSVPVLWTPDATVPEHACLFAIVDTGDDPFAASTLDPIVWPFDCAFDNNIVWHNLAVKWTNRGARPIRVDFVVCNPFRRRLPVEVRGRIERIGPKEILEMHLDPRIVAKVVALPRPVPPLAGKVLRHRHGLSVRPAVEIKGWRRSGTLSASGGWRLAAGSVAPGAGARVALQVSANNLARPGQAYRLYFEQTTGGRITGAITFVVVIGK